MDEKTKELFDKQNQAMASLVVRLTSLEQILLDKGAITEEEVSVKANQLREEFVKKTMEAMNLAQKKS